MRWCGSPPWTRARPSSRWSRFATGRLGRLERALESWLQLLGQHLPQRLGAGRLPGGVVHDGARRPVANLDHRELGRALVQGGDLSLIHISEPTRLLSISYAVFCLKK